MTTTADVAAFVSQFLTNAERYQRTYDCSNPDAYNRLVRDIAVAMTAARGFVVTQEAVHRAIDETQSLACHPMLQRGEYSNDVFSSSTPSIGSAIARGWRSLTRALTTPALSAEDERAMLLTATEDANNVREHVAAALPGSPVVSNMTDGQWYIILTVQYRATSAAEVERELFHDFSRERSSSTRPYLAKYFIFNKTSALPMPRYYLTTLFFQFPVEPLQQS